MQIHSLRNALTHRELQLYTKTGVREPPNNSKTEITKTQGKNSKRCAQNAAIHIGSHLNNIRLRHKSNTAHRFVNTAAGDKHDHVAKCRGAC